MTSFDFEGHRVWYEREGSGEPMVFLPNATLTGYAVAWNDPEEVNPIVESFLARHTPTRAASAAATLTDITGRVPALGGFRHDVTG